MNIEMISTYHAPTRALYSSLYLFVQRFASRQQNLKTEHGPAYRHQTIVSTMAKRSQDSNVWFKSLADELVPLLDEALELSPSDLAIQTISNGRRPPSGGITTMSGEHVVGKNQAFVDVRYDDDVGLGRAMTIVSLGSNENPLWGRGSSMFQLAVTSNGKILLAAGLGHKPMITISDPGVSFDNPRLKNAEFPTSFILQYEQPDMLGPEMKLVFTWAGRQRQHLQVLG